MQQQRQHSVSVPELLAPAGGPDSGYAALHYGADAVYLGLKRFSARSEAENFSISELGEFAAFAHSLTPRRRVYVTLNTLVRNDELGEAAGLLLDCAGAGADAVILQDLGLARIAQSLLPGLSLHASTQMAIHGRDGVIGVRQAGFSRVNMARELTLEELRECAAVPGIEIEAFIHGALCYSYSGLCLYSSLLRGRSGNRGGCAYPCRDRFRQTEQPSPGGLFAFSMKDLALPDQIGVLREAGVASLKIEGRKKSPLYVATVTALYRRILDGGASDDELAALAEDVRTVFSRPWTTLFSKGRRAFDTIDEQTVGHRGARIGDVISVRRGSDGNRLRFITGRPIERHDGVQVDVEGEDKPFGFSVQSLYVHDPDGILKSGFEAPAGAVVEVTLPPGAPLLAAGAPVYCASSQKTKRDYPFDRPKPGAYGIRYRLDVTIRMLPHRMMAEAIVFDGGGAKLADGSVWIEGVFSKAQDPARSEPAAREAFAKLGETPFTLGALRLENPDSLFAPASMLNKLRRDLTAMLAEKVAGQLKSLRDTLMAAHTPGNSPRICRETSETWSIAVDCKETLAAFDENDLASVDEVIFRLNADNRLQAPAQIRSITALLGPARIRIGLPLIVRGSEKEETARAVKETVNLGINRWEVGGLGGRQILESIAPQNADIRAGWSLYVLNREAAAWLFGHGYGGVTVSPEDGLRNMAPLLAEFGGRMTVPVYLDPPLMISESCATASLEGGCPGVNRCSHRETGLRSSGNEQVVLCHDQCRSIVLNRAPFSRIASLKELRTAGARHFLSEFVHRRWSAPDAVRIWREIRSGNIPDFSFAHPQRDLA